MPEHSPSTSSATTPAPFDSRSRHLDHAHRDNDHTRMAREDPAAFPSSSSPSTSAHSPSVPSNSSRRPPRRRRSPPAPARDSDADDASQVAASLLRRARDRDRDWTHLASAQGALAGGAAAAGQDGDTAMPGPGGPQDVDADADVDGEENDVEDGGDVERVPVRVDTGVLRSAASLDAPAEPQPPVVDGKKEHFGSGRSRDNAADSEADKPRSTSVTRSFQQYWQEHVSKLHPPRTWFFHAAGPPSSSSSAAAAAAEGESPLIGCTLTLTLPAPPDPPSPSSSTAAPSKDEARTLTFTTPPTHPTRRAARDAAFALAHSAGAHEAARRAREEVGWELEAEEERREGERRRGGVGGERPWERLREMGERWMAEPLRWEFDEDELNTTHACLLTVTIAPSPLSTLTFLTPRTSSSHRDAKDAAARLALDAGVPALWERAYRERIAVESGGYVPVESGGAGARAGGGAGAGAGAGAGEGEGEGEDGADGEERDATMDPVTLLHAEVKKAFGGVHKFVEWTHGNTSKGQNGSSGPPPLSCTLTLTFPPTALFPSPPAPLRITVASPSFHTKHHARTSCAARALRDGVVERLGPYGAERADEARRRREEREGRERERREEREGEGGARTPRAGTVPHEELDTLDNPLAYLNLCAQQWTGNSSPLSFEYSTAVEPGVPGKQHGCALTISLDRASPSSSLSKTYAVPPSRETPSRAAAKEAAVRRALRERVLDLLRPVEAREGVGARAGRGRGRGARKRRRAEGEGEGEGAGGEGGGAAGGGKRAKKALGAVGSPGVGAARVGGASGATASAPAPGQSAVAFLDQVCLERFGAGGLPLYDVRQDPGTGFFSASLRIPTPSPTTSDPASALAPSSSGEAVHPSRTHAQEAVAARAVRGGVVERLGRLQLRGTRSHARGLAAAAGGEGGAGVSEAGAAGGEVSRAAAGESASASRRELERQLDEGAQGEEEEEEVVVAEAHHGGGGPAVQHLREGCAAVLGSDERVLPRYRVVQKGALFSASAFVTLDQLTGAVRAFGVPASFETRDAACDAAARAALSAGVLELVHSRHRARSGPTAPSPIGTSSASASSKPRRGKQTLPARSPEEQAALRRAAYGGFGASTAATVASALARDPAREKGNREEEEREKVRASPLIPLAAPAAKAPVAQRSLPRAEAGAAAAASKPASAAGPAQEVLMDGPAVSELKAYCLAQALPIPLVKHEALPGAPGAAHRVWLVVRDQRFELPSVRGTASAARERLATKVLRHLRAQGGG